MTFAAGPTAPSSDPQAIHCPASAQQPVRPWYSKHERTLRPLYISGNWHVCRA